MEFMLLFTERRDGPPHEEGTFAAMGRYSGELADQGRLRRGAPLVDEAEGARIRVRTGAAIVSDGPFAESKEVVGGFWIVEAESRAEALEIAGRCPHARRGIVEVHPVEWRRSFADSEDGRPFLFLFRREPGLSDPDGAKLREMVEFSAARAREGRLFETAPLASEPAPARLETGDGKLLVTDGPFAETKEGVGGYGLVRARDRAAAIELARSFPHARWGPVEVREIMFFDRTNPKG
jgi:hypothetical protein